MREATRAREAEIGVLKGSAGKSLWLHRCHSAGLPFVLNAHI